MAGTLGLELREKTNTLFQRKPLQSLGLSTHPLLFSTTPFLIKKGIYVLIGSLFLESPSTLVKPSSSGAFNPQLETSLLIAVKTVMSQMGDYDFMGEIRKQDRQFQETKIFYLWECLY